MTYKENIRAILECYFTGFKEEIIDSACNRILEQEHCEDCVSRQAVLDAIRRIGMCKYSTNEIEAIDECRKAVEALPFFTAEPKTEHWIGYTTVIILEPFNSWKQVWNYSEWGYSGQDGDNDGWLKWNYCPNCGARMSEVSE